MIPIHNNGLLHYEFESLEAHKGLQHAVFSRLGGVSRPPYDSLNVGASVGDDPQAVRANNALVLDDLGVERSEVITAHLVHSTNVAVVGLLQGGQALPATDGLVSNAPVTLLLRFADCVPILLFDPLHRAIGLLHAGWKGTGAQIAAEGVRQLQRNFGSQPEDVVACIGPSIGPCCYRVGEDFVAEMSAVWPRSTSMIDRHKNVYYADLWEMNRQQLLDAGVRHVEMPGICTACRHDEFFSHRADGGLSGRFAVALRLLV
jgi:YfiH family protein